MQYHSCSITRAISLVQYHSCNITRAISLVFYFDQQIGFLETLFIRAGDDVALHSASMPTKLPLLRWFRRLIALISNLREFRVIVIYGGINSGDTVLLHIECLHVVEPNFDQSTGVDYIREPEANLEGFPAGKGHCHFVYYAERVKECYIATAQDKPGTSLLSMAIGHTDAVQWTCAVVGVPLGKAPLWEESGAGGWHLRCCLVAGSIPRLESSKPDDEQKNGFVTLCIV